MAGWACEGLCVRGGGSVCENVNIEEGVLLGQLSVRAVLWTGE